MITKQEAEFWAWKATVERNMGAFASRFDLWALGCPDYLVRAVGDVFGFKRDDRW